MTVHSTERPRDTLGRPISAKATESLKGSHISGDKASSRREIALHFDYRKGAELLNSRDFGRHRSHNQSPSEEAQKHRGSELKQVSQGSPGKEHASEVSPQGRQSTPPKLEALSKVTPEEPPITDVRMNPFKPAPATDSASRQVSVPEEVKRASPEQSASTSHVLAAQAVEVKPVDKVPTPQPLHHPHELPSQRQQAPEMTPTMKRLVEIVNNSTLDRQIGSPIKNPILEFSDKDHEALKAMLTNPAVKQELLGYSDAQIKAGFEAVRPDRIKYLHEWLAMNHRNAVNYPGFARSMGGITPADTNRIGQVVGIAQEVERKVSGL